MSPYRDITGVILAGGKSRRIGTDKALLTVEGEAFLIRIARMMDNLFHEVFIISNERRYGFLKIPVFKDVVPGRGPLGGIHSGLLHSRTKASFFVPCDMPFLSKELIEYIVNFECHADVKIPSMNNQVHPLCGLYSRSALSAIEQSLTNGRLKVQDAIASLHTVEIPITSNLPFYRSDLLLNVNEIKDYHVAIRSGSSLAQKSF